MMYEQYEQPPIAPFGSPEAAGASPWASILGGAGVFGALGMLGMGLGRKPKEPETKREKAAAALDELAGLHDDLESMTVDATCLLGSDGQGTTSPFNAETNALVGDIALLRRRVLLTKARLHSFSVPKVRESIQKLTKEVEKAEAAVVAILAMPDLSPEAEAAIKQASRDKSLVVQALSLPGAPHGLSVVADKAGISLERADVALTALVDEGLVARSAVGFEWTGRLGAASLEDVEKQKEEAVATQDFERAEELRDKAAKLKAEANEPKKTRRSRQRRKPKS